jgi:phosphate starvation-inducible PhoH-like protein|tara:strand:- start:1069 stop:1785 length:717 start_codon:yes stop_codon:yes gene_type:complete
MYLKKKAEPIIYIEMLIVCGPSKHIFIKKNQAEYVDFLQKKTPVVIASGPAGTGKTMFACKYAIESLVGRKYDKLIITRPTVPVGEEMGFLPGDIDDKMKPWMIPIYDQLEHFSNRSLLGKYFKENTIEIVPFAYIRGRTFDNTLIIADEMQNSTHHQMYTFLTRIGQNSKAILTGDLNQCDIPNASNENGLNQLLDLYHNCDNIDNDFIKHIEFDDDDVHRSEIVKYILDMYSCLYN